MTGPRPPAGDREPPRPPAARRGRLALPQPAPRGSRAQRPPGRPAPQAVAICWSAQQRLHGTWRRMERRDNRRTLIAVAVARQLAGFCWPIAQIESHHPPGALAWRAAAVRPLREGIRVSAPERSRCTNSAISAARVASVWRPSRCRFTPSVSSRADEMPDECWLCVTGSDVRNARNDGVGGSSPPVGLRSCAGILRSTGYSSASFSPRMTSIGRPSD
jgi:hypothetical protein